MADEARRSRREMSTGLELTKTKVGRIRPYPRRRPPPVTFSCAKDGLKWLFTMKDTCIQDGRTRAFESSLRGSRRLKVSDAGAFFMSLRTDLIARSPSMRSI